MEFLALLFIGKPQNILIVSVFFMVLNLVFQFMENKSKHHYGALLIVSLSWATYAAWEWTIKIKTPEANIRVDLLIIWPILAIILAWALYRTISLFIKHHR